MEIRGIKKEEPLREAYDSSRKEVSGTKSLFFKKGGN